MITINYQEEERGKTKSTENPEFAVVTSVDDTGLQLIFDGEIYPTKKKYKFNTSYSFNVGDRVKVNKQSGSYVVEYPLGSASYTLPPANPQNVKFSYTENSVSISWSDPADNDVSKWAGTYLVRNEFRIPIDETDGVVLINNKIKDAYKTNPFVDLGLISGKTYYYSLFPYSDKNKVNRDYKGFSITPVKVIKYGIKIDKTNSDPDTSVEYLYDAVGKNPAHVDLISGNFDFGDWADVGFVKECKPCMMDFSGKVLYYLDPSDYTKKEDGSPSDFTNIDHESNVMVEFPLWYYTAINSSKSLEIIISNHPISEKSTAYPFTKENGTIAQKMYISMFLVGMDANNKMRSSFYCTPQKFSRSKIENQAVSNNLSDKYSQSSWVQREYIGALLMILSKSLNTQKSFGYGPKKQYKMDNYISSQFWGKDDSADETMNVFFLRNWWGDPYWVFGGAMKGHYTRISNTFRYYRDFFVKSHPPFYFRDMFYEDDYTYKKTMFSLPKEGKYLSNTDGFTPKDVVGSATTYYCSYCEIDGTQDEYLDSLLASVGDRRSGAIGIIKNAYNSEGYFRLACHL